MEITSLYFFILSVISIIIFYLLKHKYRVIFLTVLSCTFIASYNYYLLIYVIAYSLINYFIGIVIPGSKLKKVIFWAGVFINLFQLIILKYSSFAIDPIFKIFNSTLNISQLSEIIIPLGVSFFTMQGIGYLININMGWEKPEKNFLNFLLYIIFYPKFLSGPIERSSHFLPQLKVIQSFNEPRVTYGLRIALFGVFKKVAIANQLAPLVNSAYANLNLGDSHSLWIILLIQPLYIYFDFSGYTDIAIGFAKTFGIDIIPNFNKPFLAENVTTFWKRFHISLSSWFNDYVFRQASYKLRRWGIYASVLGVFVTWILFGIWHGAGWNFIVLGLLQALAINFEFFTKRIRLKFFSKVPDYIRIWFGRLLTYFFYALSLVFFFSADLNSACEFFSKLFVLNSVELTSIRKEVFFLVLIFAMVFLIIEIIDNDFKNIYNKLELFWISDKKKFKLLRWLLYLLLITSIVVLSNDVQHFIYFQF